MPGRCLGAQRATAEQPRETVRIAPAAREVRVEEPAFHRFEDRDRSHHGARQPEAQHHIVDPLLVVQPGETVEDDERVDSGEEASTQCVREGLVGNRQKDLQRKEREQQQIRPAQPPRTPFARPAPDARDRGQQDGERQDAVLGNVEQLIDDEPGDIKPHIRHRERDQHEQRQRVLVALRRPDEQDHREQRIEPERRAGEGEDGECEPDIAAARESLRRHEAQRERTGEREHHASEREDDDKRLEVVQHDMPARRLGGSRFGNDGVMPRRFADERT